MNPFDCSLTRWMAILVAASVLFAVGCDGPEADGPRQGDDTTQTRDSDDDPFFEQQERQILSYPCDTFDRLPADVANLLADSTTLHNEVHDCQKLVVVDQGRRRFGPRVGIFPILSGPVRMGDSSLVVATIFNWDEESYLPLGISSGWNCLVLMPTGSGSWTAEIRPTSDRCVEPTFARGDPVTLNVTPTPNSEIPVTARWGWDDDTDMHYIGVPCPVSDAWCEIGPNGVTPRAWVRNRVPGWYDQQHLAVQGDTALEPGPWATIFPGRDVPGATMRTFRVSGGVPAAYVLLENTTGADAYSERFGFEPTSGVDAPGSGNVIRLELTDATWHARVYTPGNANGSPAKEFIVDYVEIGHGASGSVRWRWTADDESWWIACPDGCCSPVENGTITY